MDFPIGNLMDSEACYRFLLDILHPDGLCCPGCRRSDAMAVHHRRHQPVLDYRCRHCGSVFNAYTGTPLHKTHRSPTQLVLILRGICQGTPTAQLARELHCDRKHLLGLRHKLQELALRAATRSGPVAGQSTEADEMFQNAGEKRHSASRSRRPAPTTSQQATRAWHLRERPTSRGRGGQSRHGGNRVGGS